MLSVKEKSMLAEYVRENNLHRTNVMSKEVYPKEGIYSKYIKRILDIIVSLVVLIITCPVNICIGICTYFGKTLRKEREKFQDGKVPQYDK